MTVSKYILYVLALVICGAFFAVPVVYAADAPASYTLGIGEEIRVIVYGEPDLSGDFTVSSEGLIAMPLIGDIHVEGLGLRAVEAELRERFADGYLIEPSVSLEVTKYRPFYILGEVRAPGSYSYVNDMSVLNAVALAGGFTYRANRKAVKVMEGAQNDVLDDYEILPVRTKIAPGDVIVVQERFF